MPDAGTIREIVSGGVGVVALVVMCFFFWLMFKQLAANAVERTATLATLERIADSARAALDRNTEAVTKLESAVEKLERRIDDHDRVLDLLGRTKGAA